MMELLENGKMNRQQHFNWWGWRETEQGKEMEREREGETRVNSHNSVHSLARPLLSQFLL